MHHVARLCRLIVIIAFIICVSGVVTAAAKNNTNVMNSSPEGVIAPASPPYDFSPGTGYTPGEVIVRFKPDKDLSREQRWAAHNSVHNRIGSKLKHDFEDLGLSDMQVVDLPAGMSVEDAVSSYKADPSVLYVQPNYIVQVAAVPNDSNFSELWGMVKIRAPAAWDIITGSKDIVVAVVDTGVNFRHQDLSENIWNNTDEIPDNGIDDDHNGFTDDIRGWDFAYGDNNPRDDYGHGTHCAGTIGAVGNNSQGVAGVNWNVTIMPVKFMDSTGQGSTEDAIQAIQYAADNGADILSCSWGASGKDQALDDAIVQSRTLVVCAAGNEGVNSDISPFYPASGNATNIISVAASDSNDNKATFSNYGVRTVDVAAPGYFIFSTMPGNSYSYMSGTSMATPHVAGLAALIMAENPELNISGVKNIILGTVDVTGQWNGKVLSNGRINALRAIQAASGQPVASFTVNPISGYAPLVVSFTDHSFNAPSSREWDFGDGTPHSSEWNPVHTYASPGTYSVTLTVDGGHSVSQHDIVTVRAQPVPVASFTADPVSGTAPVFVEFTDTSSGTPSSWDWSFGDGSPNSTARNPTHEYSRAGVYDVALTVANAGGRDCRVREDLITVEAPPVFLAGWSYRKAHDLEGSNGGDLTDYQVRFRLYRTGGTDSGGDCYLGSTVSQDFSDIRITTAENTPVPFWIQDVTNDCATIWAKIPTIPTEGTRVYIYWGNPTALSASDGNDTFLFFEDFAEATVDMTRWTVGGLGNVSLANGTVSIRARNSNKITLNGLIDNSGNNIVFGVRHRIVSDSRQNSGFRIGIKGGYKVCFVKQDGRHISRFRNDGSEWGRVIGTFTPQKWYTTEVYYSGTRILTRNDPDTKWNSWKTSGRNGHISLSANAADGGTAAAEIDYVYQRKIVSPEPGHGWWGTAVMDG